MKKLLAAIVAFGVLGFASMAQAQHTVTLTWSASADSTTANPGTVSVFRAAGNCPTSGIGTLTYTAISTTAPAAGPFTDSTTISGNTYCYYVEAVIGGVASAPSNTFQGTIGIAAPTKLVGTIN